VKASFTFSVLASSATMLFEYVVEPGALPAAAPSPTATKIVPSVPNVRPAVPATPPPLVFHDTGVFASLPRSSAQTPSGAAPQPFAVLV
jgi:hypothetical protein